MSITCTCTSGQAPVNLASDQNAQWRRAHAQHNQTYQPPHVELRSFINFRLCRLPSPHQMETNRNHGANLPQLFLPRCQHGARCAGGKSSRVRPQPRQSARRGAHQNEHKVVAARAPIPRRSKSVLCSAPGSRGSNRRFGAGAALLARHSPNRRVFRPSAARKLSGRLSRDSEGARGRASRRDTAVRSAKAALRRRRAAGRRRAG